MAVAVHFPPLLAVKPAILVMDGEAVALVLSMGEVLVAVAGAVPFCVWKSVMSGSRRL